MLAMPLFFSGGWVLPVAAAGPRAGTHSSDIGEIFGGNIFASPVFYYIAAALLVLFFLILVTVIRKKFQSNRHLNDPLLGMTLDDVSGLRSKGLLSEDEMKRVRAAL